MTGNPIYSRANNVRKARINSIVNGEDLRWRRIQEKRDSRYYRRHPPHREKEGVTEENQEEYNPLSSIKIYKPL